MAIERNPREAGRASIGFPSDRAGRQLLSIGAWLSCAPGIYAIVAPFALLLPSHAFDPNWPPHARFHVTWGAGKLLAIGINQFILSRFGLRRGLSWSWFALAVNLIFGGLVVIPASRFHHGPLAPARRHDRSTQLGALTLLLGLLGLAISAGPLLKRHDREEVVLRAGCLRR
jgi:hypothetical protein